MKVYCIGLSRDHDAYFLNNLAKIGTEVGNFIYIDTYEVGYLEEMKTSLNESLNMVLSSSGQPKFVITDNKNLNFVKMSEVVNEFPEKLIDPQEDMAEQAEDEGEAWSKIKFHTALVLTETDLKNCTIDLSFSS